MMVTYFICNPALRAIAFQTESKSELFNPFAFIVYQHWELALALQNVIDCFAFRVRSEYVFITQTNYYLVRFRSKKRTYPGTIPVCVYTYS